MNKFELQSHYEQIAALNYDRKFRGDLRYRSLIQKASTTPFPDQESFNKYVQDTLASDVPLPGQSYDEFKAIKTAFNPLIKVSTEQVYALSMGQKIKVDVVLVDADECDITLTKDGFCVTNAELADGVLTITVPEYVPAVEREGFVTITLTLSGAEVASKTIHVLQRGY